MAIVTMEFTHALLYAVVTLIVFFEQFNDTKHRAASLR